MTGKELFETWASNDSTWSQWVSPALFAQIDCADGGAEASVDAPAPIWHEHKASPESAVVIDLPGADSIRLALVLAERGYRPVPIINACPGPVGLQLNFLPNPANVSPQSIVVLDMSSLVREICVGTAFLKKLTLLHRSSFWMLCACGAPIQSGTTCSIIGGWCFLRIFLQRDSWWSER